MTDNLELAKRWMGALPRDQFDLFLALSNDSYNRGEKAGAIATAREVEGLRGEVARLYTIILENSPDTPIADNGMTVWDGLQNEARAALEGAEAPQSPIPLELKPIHFRLLERGANSRYIGLSNNSGVRMGEHAALGQLMRAGLVRFTEDSQPPGPRMPTPCEITDAGRAALNGKGG